MPTTSPMTAATSSASSIANVNGGAASTCKAQAGPTAAAAAAPQSSSALRRAPSLSEIAASIKSQNPEKWERIRKKSIAAASDNNNNSNTTATSFPMGQSKSLDATSLASSSSVGGVHVQRETVLSLQSASMAQSTSASSEVSATSGTSAADSITSGSSLEAPRLRLTARLAAAAPAPLLSRSQSTNAIVHSNDGVSASLPNEGPPAAVLSGSSLPALSNLQSTLARRSSVSATASSSSSSQSLPSRGLPSLEAIEKRFAQKKEKEKDKDAFSAYSVGAIAAPAAIIATTSVAQTSIAGTPTASGTVKLESKTPSDASKENIDPKTGMDASQRSNVTINEVASVSMSKASSSASSTGSSNSPTTPTDVTMPLSDKSTISQHEHPLQHKWTLYYDSRNNTRAGIPAVTPATPTSVGHPNGSITTATIPTGKQQYEAGLSTLATVNTVENFCRLYNWLKKPSKLLLNENLHLFKENILPMWEDENNKKGGKWTICLDPKILNVRDLLDKFWMFLCFALIGEDFEEKNDLICGAVVSVRPRTFRFQVWIREKDDIQSVNIIGRNLIRILELENPSTGARLPGISLDFSTHSKPSPPAQKYLFIPAIPVPAPSSAFQAHPGGFPSNTGSGLTTPSSRGSIPSSSSSNSISSLSSRTSGLSGNPFANSSGIGLSRAVSMNAIASKLASGNLPEQVSVAAATSNGNGNWRERLGQGSRKSSLAA